MSEAEHITRNLNGDWRGHHGLAPCPICQPERRRDQRALSISEKGGRLLLYCHKGGCDAFSALRERGVALVSRPYDPLASERERKNERAKQRKRTDAANNLFKASRCCAGTLVESYLASRGIKGLRFDLMQRTLRFHPALKHSPSGKTLPAMIARIREVGGFPMGIHRTFLDPDGTAKADVKPVKMMLGPSAGGAVRFGPDRPMIVIAEGIETALSICRASRVTCWAALSATGMKGLDLPPPPVAEVAIIAADNDAAGLEAAESLAARLEAEGRAVSIIHPPSQGADFNDVLRGG